MLSEEENSTSAAPIFLSLWLVSPSLIASHVTPIFPPTPPTQGRNTPQGIDTCLVQREKSLVSPFLVAHNVAISSSKVFTRPAREIRTGHISPPLSGMTFPSSLCHLSYLWAMYLWPIPDQKPPLPDIVGMQREPPHSMILTSKFLARLFYFPLKVRVLYLPQRT